MPEVKQVDPTLRILQYHGLELKVDGEQATGACPFCGKEGKFSVNLKSTQWRCFSCNKGEPGKKNPGIRGGNVQVFLRHYYESVCRVDQSKLEELAKDRKLLSWESLKEWGVKVSPRGEFVIPGYSADGKLMTLYRYLRSPKGKRYLNPTPGCGQHLGGVNLFDKSKINTHYCEGYWDGVAYWETLSRTKEVDGILSQTGAKSSSLLKSINVVSIPGAGTFLEQWGSLCKDKNTVFLYDSDHPKKRCPKCNKSESIVKRDGKCPKCGSELGDPSTGLEGTNGMRGAIETLHVKADDKPKSIQVLKWGPEGYDETLPSGFDVRDALTKSPDVRERIKLLHSLRERIEDVSEEWLQGAEKLSKETGLGIQPRDCDNYKEVINSFRKCLNITPRIDLTLSAMLATAVSTKASGTAQLWLRVIGPPSSGKSTMCEALAVSQHVFSKSTIKGLFSAYKTDKEGKEDNSLIPKLKDKTFIVKDADSLMKAPNVAEIMSQFRDSFDKNTRMDARNGISRDYLINFTAIFAGTGSIQALDQSDLGERFLSCRIVEDQHNDDLEDDIALRVAYRAKSNMSLESNGKAESMTDPKLVESMQLCGGYLNHLRENAQDLLSQVDCPDESMMQIIHMAQLVSYLRARPPKGGSENVEKEWSARLVEQFMRLGMCLTVVLNKTTVDAEVLSRCHKVCEDTCRGRVLSMARYLYSQGSAGAETRFIAQATHHTDSQEREMLRFLKRIGAVESFEVKDTQGKSMSAKIRWRLTDRVRKLYRNVMVPVVAETKDAT